MSARFISQYIVLPIESRNSPPQAGGNHHNQSSAARRTLTDKLSLMPSCSYKYQHYRLLKLLRHCHHPLYSLASPLPPPFPSPLPSHPPLRWRPQFFTSYTRHGQFARQLHGKLPPSTPPILSPPPALPIPTSLSPSPPPLAPQFFTNYT